MPEDANLPDEIENLSTEDYLAPPKYDTLGIFMVFLSAIITGVIAGIIIILMAFLMIGQFSFESGASPILLSFITFWGLFVANLLFVVILAYIFPNIYSRGKTGLSQVMVMSLMLYILFIPVYIGITEISAKTQVVLVAFSAHLIINNFALTLITGLVAQYRYSILMLYSSLISFLITAMIVILIQLNLSDSRSSLFLLLGLPILTYTLSGTLSAIVSWLYYRLYRATGLDPIGSIFSRIQQEEEALENLATDSLTKFTPR